MIQGYSYMVSVRCATFNHAPYIEDALRGFAMQKCNFPVAFVVIDDASEDGEPELLRNWAEARLTAKPGASLWQEMPYGCVAEGTLTERPNLTFAFILLNENHYSKRKSKLAYMSKWCEDSKYIAMCEGDDYWQDPQKIQLQVGFLENHPDYGMCYSSFDRLFQNEGRLEHDLFRSNPGKFPKEYSLESFLLRGGYVAPPSWVVRRELWNSVPLDRLGSKDGTFVLFSFFLAKSKVHVFEKPMVVYRVLEESASHTKDYSKEYARNLSVLNDQLKMIELFGLSEGLADQCRERYYRMSLPKFIVNNRQKDIDEARDYIKNTTMRDRVLFALNRIGGGKFLLRLTYSLREIWKHRISLSRSVSGVSPTTIATT